MLEQIDSVYEPDRYGESPRMMLGVFTLGNKRLDMDINLVDGTIGTGISNLEGFESRRIPGATTRLYEHAYEIMVDEATKLGRNLTYKLSTRDENMKLWANVYGRRIYGWESFSFKGSKLVATTTIRPRVPILSPKTLHG